MTTQLAPVSQQPDRWFWVTIPAWVSRYSFTLGNSLTDGVHLLRWPIVARLGPLVAAILGIALGLVQGGPSFTTSRVMMAIVIAVGVTSVQLGFWLWLGYSLAYLLGGPSVGRPRSFFEVYLGVPGSKTTVLLLMWLFAVAVGMTVLAIRIDLRRRDWDSRYSSGLTTGTYIAVVGLVTFFLTRAMPILVRPVFTWVGSQPDVDAVVPIQSTWWVVVAVAVAAAGARSFVERRAVDDRVLGAVSELSQSLSAPVTGRTAKWPKWIQLALPAIGLTFLVSSLIENVVQAGGVLIFFVGLIELRSRIIERGWLSGVARIPVLFRFGLGILLTAAITRVALGLVSRRIGNSFFAFETDSFLAALVAVCLSLAVFVVLTAPPLVEEGAHR